MSGAGGISLNDTGVEASLAALDPRSRAKPCARLRLARRPYKLENAKIALVQTMPPGSGLEATVASAEAELKRRFPVAGVTRVVRRDFLVDDPAERARLVKDFDVAVLFIGPAATIVNVAFRYGCALESAGLPLVTAIFAEYSAIAANCAETLGAPLRVVAMPPALATDGESLAFVRQLIDGLLTPLAGLETGGAGTKPSARPRIALEGSSEEIRNHFETQGWSDGLPIVVPTELAVAEMLRGTSRPSDSVVAATLRPEGRKTTVEMVAINAVMAGARPRHLPVILAAVSQFNDIELESMTRSVNSFGFTFLVAGPIVHELGIQTGMNALGRDNLANSAITRAIGLVIRNCGGQIVGVTSTPAIGNATGYTLFAENDAESPWPPYHVAAGHRAEEDLITLFTGAFGFLGNFYYRGLDDAAGIMTRFESAMGALVVLTPKRARQLCEDGYATREAVEEYLWSKTVVRLGDFRASGFFPLYRSLMERPAEPGSALVWPGEYLTGPDERMVSFFPPAGVKVVVAGGSGSSLMQVWNSAVRGTACVGDWR